MIAIGSIDGGNPTRSLRSSVRIVAIVVSAVPSPSANAANSRFWMARKIDDLSHVRGTSSVCPPTTMSTGAEAEVPRTPSGKIYKPELRTRLLAEDAHSAEGERT
jgi:hypothetical protein